jgi:bifunctional non-homologous end joining protein LigD
MGACLVTGKKVVVTGVIPGHSRATAEAALRDAGAQVQSGVTRETDLLVTGGKVGATKMNKAAALGVSVVPWEQALAGGAGGSVVAALNAKARLAAARTVAPMLAKAGELPAGGGWLFEVKWDGYRCVATVVDGQVAMQSRSGKSDYAAEFPRVAAALAGLPDCVIDGELVVLDANGDSSLESLSSGRGTGAESLIVFDVLELGGVDLRSRPLTERRQALADLAAAFPPSIAVSPAFEDGEELLAWAAGRGLEGIVAKRAGSSYREGSRTDAWLKVKLRCEQEFVVVGWREGEGARAGMIGSLLLAVNDDDGDLVFVGRVGTGGTDADWENLRERLRPCSGPLDLDSPLFDLATMGAPQAELRDVQWVVPEVVVQVRFQRWTEDGRLWHPSVVGVREDKLAGEVVREPAAAVA